MRPFLLPDTLRSPVLIKLKPGASSGFLPEAELTDHARFFQQPAAKNLYFPLFSA